MGWKAWDVNLPYQPSPGGEVGGTEAWDDPIGESGDVLSARSSTPQQLRGRQGPLVPTYTGSTTFTFTVEPLVIAAAGRLGKTSTTPSGLQKRDLHKTGTPRLTSVQLGDRFPTLGSPTSSSRSSSRGPSSLGLPPGESSLDRLVPSSRKTSTSHYRPQVKMHFNSIVVSGLVAVASHQVNAVPCPKPAPVYKPITSIQLGPRPYWLVNDMDEGPLKEKLQSCSEQPIKPSSWSIGHRGGGTMMIPEESVESNLAGARMGAGVLECDVAFTKDRQLVCRHSQCDLHTTTNIITMPELNAKCTTPFTPAGNGTAATAKCCTSDITVAEFKTLCSKMDGFNASAVNPKDFLLGTPRYRTDLYSTCGTVMTHKEHIAMTNDLGLQFTPELKVPEVKMPFEGDYTQEQYAQQLIDEYKEAGIAPERVWPQSFYYPDILYWLEAEPEFGKQGVLLDESGDTPETYPGAVANLTQFAAAGVKIMAPPLYYLVTVEDGKIVPSSYATRAKELGLKIISWSLERSGFLGDDTKGGYYYTSIANVTNNDGDVYNLLHVLAQDVGVLSIFSDWSATVTYYANCFGLF
ncbi:glycerophosphoryl diester phosphodiesterase [Colletotrichum simmondsii]|uniref:glycerophosphodiester phosphodiesterase n=1 Tax=Colletotrichum simmondsii TaxID=703756 RepID=A0A135SRT1_9PEZI|nr:glycerophosphoryl diester phosphodiesterase [Colletotrichum simmondsii]